MNNKTYLTELDCKRLIDGSWQSGTISLVKEYELNVRANGAPLPTVMCSPADPEELICGLLITCRRIRSIAQITSIRIDESEAAHRIDADVLYADANPISDGKCANWDANMIRRLSEYIIRDAGAHRGSHSTHSCTLMRGGKIIASREDIGRHNAIDRAIGWAARSGVPINECVVFFSGRISGTAVEKAAAAGITVLCGKALPTARAVQLAKEHNITLLHYSEHRGCILF